MGYARSHTVPQDAGGIYHCFSRCVRRERLLESPDGAQTVAGAGSQASPEAKPGTSPDTSPNGVSAARSASISGAPGSRIELLERRLAFLSTRVFAVDLIEFKPMGNHIHSIVRTHPELAWCWSDEEVARRWLRLSLAGRRADLDEGEEPSDQEVAELAARKSRIRVLRRRLGNLGAYHSAWKEWTAKRWNRQDRVSGHFWQGRYGATTALDDGAVLTQSVYVLLNAVHAGLEAELGTGTAGSLKTRINRLLREVAAEARENAKAAAFEEGFVHASWTPVYPCSPGSARKLSDADFAKCVAAGLHRESFRNSLREDAMALIRLASLGDDEEVERAARALRGQHAATTLAGGEVSSSAGPAVSGDVDSSPMELATSTPSNADRQRRRVPTHRPTNAPRHRSHQAQPAGQAPQSHQAWPALATPRRTQLKPNEGAWLQRMENPFHESRLVDGAVPVIRGMTLGMLIGLADREGRYQRPDKSGYIASNAEAAIASLRRGFLDELPAASNDTGEDKPATARHASDTPDLRKAADDDAARSPAIAAALRLTRDMRSQITALAATVCAARDDPSEAERHGRAQTNAPIAMSSRGTAFGSRESLVGEAQRRGGTSVHAVRPQLRG